MSAAIMSEPVVPSAAPPLVIRLFGSLDVEIRGEAIGRPRTRKDLWLLALLVLKYPQNVDRDWLAGVLWPDSEEGQALYNLRRCLTNLRESLGAEAHRLTAPAPRALSLNLEGANVDVVVFDAATSRQQKAQPDAKPDEQQREPQEIALCAAVERYRGPLLESCYEEWAVQERRAREQSYIAALETLAGYAQQRQEWSEVARLLRAVLAVEPLSECALRGLMEALAAEGNPAAAIETYRAFRLRLLNDLNATPDPETRACYDRIRTDARRPVPPLSPSTPPQMSPISSSAEPPSTAPGNLPQSLTQLIGRDRDREEMRAGLAASRLVTLVGMGGMGKTRLALEVGRDVAEEYEDGVWFVDLAPLTDPALLLPAVMQAMQIKDEQGHKPALDALTERLQSKSLLLVLDNCEHLIAASALAADKLLRACPRLRILATSREPLNLPGELVRPLSPLSFPPLVIENARPVDSQDKTELPSLLMEYEAVRLLVERAWQAQPTFRLTPQNALAVALICRRLDGIPLALELTASRIRTLTVEQIAARLDDRFRLLTGGNRAALPRHQTLRALLDWSYDLLPELERYLLRSLSVFVGGWTLEAAEAVTAKDEGGVLPFGWTPRRKDESNALPPSSFLLPPSEVLDLLGSLVEKSLVVREETQGEVRYRLLESIRQYGQEKLAANSEGVTIAQRHCDWLTAWVEAIQADMTGSRQPAAFRAIEREHDNVRAVLDFYPEQPGGIRLALHIASKLWPFWHTRGYAFEAWQRFQKLLAYPESNDFPLERAGALHAAGIMAWSQGDWAAAQAWNAECLQLQRSLNNLPGISASLGNISLVEKLQGNYEAARVLQEESLVIARQLEDKRRISVCLINLGNIYGEMRDLDTAARLMEESLTLRREFDDKRAIALALSNLARIGLRLWQRETVARYLRECLELCRDLEDKRTGAYAIEAMSVLLRLHSQFELAARLYGVAQAMRERYGIQLSESDQKFVEEGKLELTTQLANQHFHTLLMEGRALSWEAAITHALQCFRHLPAGEPTSPELSTAISARQERNSGAKKQTGPC